MLYESTMRAYHHGLSQAMATRAAGPVPEISPADNAPGADALQNIASAVMTYSMWGGVIGMAISLVVWGLGRWLSNHMAASMGRMGFLGAMGTLVLLGGLVSIANWAFDLGGTIKV